MDNEALLEQDLKFFQEVEQYEADRQARFDKHRKASRNFPAFKEVAVGDRFTVPKGTSVMSSILQHPIITHDDIKVEVTEIVYADLNCENSFSTKKLVFNQSNGWEVDRTFGNITVEYTDLKDWHYKSK